MRVTGARVAIDAIHSEHRDLTITEGRLLFGPAFSHDDPVLDLDGYLLLPGLINAHDHLEFNLFPRLGKGPYPNAKAWANDIYRPEQTPIREHLQLSKRARLFWGGLKNLISGVTTVAHHNGFDHEFFDSRFPVKVVQQYGWAHSLDFSPDLRDRWEETPTDWPFVVHAAEGTDEKAQDEIHRLDGLRILNNRAVLVHAIGLTQSDLKLLQERGSAIVWCPSSNLSIYGRTLDCRTLCSGLNIALGTETRRSQRKAILIDEIAVARRFTRGCRSKAHFTIWSRLAQRRYSALATGEGSLCDGGVADVVAVHDEGQTPAEALETRPEIVIVNGVVRLISTGLRARFAPAALDTFYALRRVEGRGDIWVDADVPALLEETKQVLGPDIHLAGKRVC